MSARGWRLAQQGWVSHLGDCRLFEPQIGPGRGHNLSHDKRNRTIAHLCTLYQSPCREEGYALRNLDKKPVPQVIIRHEFTGESPDDIQVGLKVWASFLADHYRSKAKVCSTANKTKGRSA